MHYDSSVKRRVREIVAKRGIILEIDSRHPNTMLIQT
jgi:hypothetical protein